MLPADTPDRTRLRRIVSAAFTPRVVSLMPGSIATCASDLRDVASARGDGLDVVRDLVYSLPAIIVAALPGLPVKDWSRVKVLWVGLITVIPQQRYFAQLDELHVYWRALIAERRDAPLLRDRA